MNRLKSAITTAWLVASLGACSVAPPSPFEFNYDIDNAKAIGIVQVFDLNGNTVVQIRNLDPRTTHVYDPAHVELPHEVMGQTVVLAGIKSSFTVTTALGSAHVVRSAQPPAGLAAGAVGSSGGGQIGAASEMSREELLVQIARIKNELADLKAKRATGSAPLIVAGGPGAAGAVLRGASATDETVIKVYFKNNSQQFMPTEDARVRILALVKAARPIQVRGFTDSLQPTATSQGFAKGRAEAARRYLVRQGVDQKNITVNYEPAAKPDAVNGTEKGRADNRRVEISAS
jgi:outer membrane protein OmpA-like peptidoglycan-associated protein